MLKDVIKTFEKEYKKRGEEYITDAHIPTDGEYIIVLPKDGGFEILDTIHIKQDKKTREIERTSPHFDFVQQADYMSRYLESNKAISDKNIHSNNYLTFFVKKENLHNGKINYKVISDYYEVFKNPFKKYNKPQQKEAYENIEAKNGKSDIDEIGRIEEWIKSNIYTISTGNDKSYLKIFFKYDINKYRKESEKYILTNIYNSADYNTIINDEIFGLPNDNMGLNSKKPYLENKSRKSKIPYFLSQDEVLMQKKFFDYLMNQATAGKTNIYTNDEKIIPKTNDELIESDFKGYFLRVKKGMEVEILDFDTIGLYSCNIRPFDLMNVIRLEKSKLEYKKTYKLDDLKNIINEVFFSRFLTSNYFTEPKDIKIYDPALKRNLLLARTTLFAWFYKGVDNNVWKILKQISLDLIKGSINKGYLTKASEQFNLSFSLKNYFEEGEDMPDVLVDIKNTLREKIGKDTKENKDNKENKGNRDNKEDTGSIESDKEYYFAVGQLSSYFISLSKSKTKPHSLANPIFNAKTDARIKEELKKLFKKYNYTIYSNKKFNNLYAMVASYEPEGRVMDDLIIAGYLHSNLVYETSDNTDKTAKDKKEENTNNENKGDKDYE
ncbi:type I-B CRISPR-associated protein Cas8b/Csh1 [Alkaliphilus sp. MSJ-5]|uniref:Type I-B CRISPR-associated protein Cas8b/Csh1 n=1 Tax=Alkaliphilus flagellatus TaxID=2841507 RepID=A0ABS6G4C6_9FIRM|nr:type I-B CRISPR-associated protein Cas8b/Csh1 [Alkaliphilus flagellatus]MBU5677234.1 type I-B CRISPR-associated protein Cas8b/Csh1 [Alkaliphilus flagellatus]